MKIDTLTQDDLSNYPCQFEIWDKTSKKLCKCGKNSKIVLQIESEDDLQGFCSEHYIDAIMQLQEHNVDIPSEVLKQIKVSK